MTREWMTATIGWLAANGHRRWISALLVVASLCLPGRAAAQGGTADLVGTVLDAQDKGVPGAAVSLTSAATGAVRQGVADAEGAYRFLLLPPGTYALRVSATGFRPVFAEGLALKVDTTTRFDVRLEIGVVTEVVRVTAETPTVNMTDASIGNVVEGSQILELPLEGRNVVGLLSLQPGVVDVPPVDSTDSRSGAVGGARGDQSNITLDGIDVNDNQF